MTIDWNSTIWRHRGHFLGTWPQDWWPSGRHHISPAVCTLIVWAPFRLTYTSSCWDGDLIQIWVLATAPMTFRKPASRSKSGPNSLIVHTVLSSNHNLNRIAIEFCPPVKNISISYKNRNKTHLSTWQSSDHWQTSGMLTCSTLKVCHQSLTCTYSPRKNISSPKLLSSQTVEWNCIHHDINSASHPFAISWWTLRLIRCSSFNCWMKCQMDGRHHMVNANAVGAHACCSLTHSLWHNRTWSSKCYQLRSGFPVQVSDHSS